MQNVCFRIGHLSHKKMTEQQEYENYIIVEYMEEWITRTKEKSSKIILASGKYETLKMLENYSKYLLTLYCTLPILFFYLCIFSTIAQHNISMIITVAEGM